MEHLYSTEGQETKDNLIKDPTQDPVNIEGMTDSDLFLCKECDCDISNNENEEVCSLNKDHDSENSDGVVNLEIELIEALKEIQRLRQITKRQATKLTQLSFQGRIEDNCTKENVSSGDYKSDDESFIETNQNDSVNTQEELKKVKEEKTLLTKTLQNTDERCQAQEHEIVSLEIELKEVIQQNLDMKQEEKNLKDQLQEKEE